MDWINHWIPACAGMTEEAGVKNSAGMAKGLSGWRQTRSDPRRHSSEGWNPGRRRRDGKQTPTPKGHSRYAGIAY